MKRFTMLFCTALATIWAMPALALDWEMDVELIAGAGIGTEEVWLEAKWLTATPSEFIVFNPTDFSIEVEVDNVGLLGNAGDLVINVYDSTGDLLTQETNFDFVMGANHPEYIIAINPSHFSSVNGFMSDLASGSVPGAASFGIKVMLEADPCIDSVDWTEVEGFHMYGGFELASDEAASPPIVGCPAN